MFPNIKITPEMIKSEKKEVQELLSKLSKTNRSSAEARRIRKRLRKLGVRLSKRSEKKKKLVKWLFDEREKIRKKREAEIVKPSVGKGSTKIFKYALMLAQHGYDTPAKIAEILDMVYRIPRSEGSKIAKEALKVAKDPSVPYIEHAGMIENNPPKGVRKIYDKVLAIEAKKGPDSLFPNESFRHDFKEKTSAEILGLPDGSLLIRSKEGKRLWKNFSY